MEEQPKDYVDEYDKIVKEAYDASPLHVRIMYQLQEYIIVTIASAFLLGYLAGVYFGK